MRGGLAGRPVLPVLVLGDSSETLRARETLASAGALASRVWSLVLTGWSRDDVDAVAVCKAVRSTSGRNRTPVVVLTDRAADTHPDEVLEAGADDFVGTPFEAAELLARIRVASRPRPPVGTDLQFAALVANIPGTVYRCEVDEFWTMLFLSDRVEELSGYPAADFVANAQRSFASIIHPDDRRDVESVVAGAVHHGDPFEVRYRIITADEDLAASVRETADRIRDDGTGFEPPTGSPGQLGLTSMRERLDRVDGRLEVLSVPGEGTIVRAAAPIARGPHAAAAKGAP